MKILIIKLSPVEGLNSSMLRALALAKGFIETGHEVDFLTIPSSSTHTRMSKKSFFKDMNIIYAQNNAVYDGIVSNKKNNIIKKHYINIARKIYHKFTIFNYTKSIAKNLSLDILNNDYYDLVVSISDPKTSHIGAEKLFQKGLRKGKYVQYWGDPLTLDITSKTMHTKGYIKRIESNLLAESDAIFYASPITLRKQKRIFKKYTEKMYFIPTPYIEKKIYNENKKSEKFEVGYFGAYNSNIRNISPLYDASKELEVNLTIVGDSDLNLKEQKNIKILSRREIDKYEKNMDLLVCIMNSKGTQIPGKIFHYASTNKAILLLVDGEYGEEIADYFRNYNRFYIVQNNKVEIKKFLNTFKENQGDFKPLKEFSGKSVAEKMLRYLEES